MADFRLLPRGSWQLRFYVDGKRQSKVIRATNQPAAGKELRKIKREVDTGNYVVPSKH